MQITANGIKLEVEEHGAGSNPALILIRGLGTQLIHWPRELIEGFVAQGFRVITFDNRDIGLSEGPNSEPVPNLPILAVFRMDFLTQLSLSRKAWSTRACASR